MQKKTLVLRKSLIREHIMLKKIIEGLLLVALAFAFAGLFVWGWSI
jgi:hypothetical protein